MKIPTAEEVRAYLTEIGYEIDPEYFLDFYAAKGWKVGKVPMVDWKATVRNWKRHGWPQVKANEYPYGLRGMNMSLGALQLELKRVKDEMQNLRNPGGSAYPAPIVPGPKLDRLNELARLKASIEKRIEAALP